MIAEKYTKSFYNLIESNLVHSIRGLKLPRNKIVDSSILRVLARSIKRNTSFYDLFFLVRKYNCQVKENRKVLRLKAVTEFYKPAHRESDQTQDESDEERRGQSAMPMIDLSMFSEELGKRVCGWPRQQVLKAIQDSKNLAGLKHIKN